MKFQPEAIPAEDLIGESPLNYLPAKLPTTLDKQKQLARVLRAFEGQKASPKIIEMAKSLHVKKPEWISEEQWNPPPTEIDPRSNMAAYMLAWGMPNDEISKTLGITKQAAGKMRGDNLVKLKVREIQERVFGFDPMKAIRQLVPQSIGKVAEIMHNEDAKSATQLAAAQDILDRGLGKAVQNIKVEETSIRKVLETLDHFKKAGIKDVQSVVSEDGKIIEPKVEIENLDVADQWIKEMYEGDKK